MRITQSKKKPVFQELSVSESFSYKDKPYMKIHNRTTEEATWNFNNELKWNAVCLDNGTLSGFRGDEEVSDVGKFVVVKEI